MSYQRIKRLFYTFAFFDDFVLIYPLYGVLFADRGLNAAQISSLFIAWSVTAFMCEVPAGSVADKYSRRSVLLVAVLMKALGFTGWLLFQNYAGFFLGFVLWGVSGSLISGTEEALVYDELKRADRTKQYAKITGTMGSLRLAALAAASFAASPFAHLGYTLILALSIVAILLSAVPLLLLPRAKQAEQVAELHYLAHIRQGFALILRNDKVLFIVAYGAIITGLNADEYYSLFFNEKGFSHGAVAFLIGLLGVVGAVCSLLAHRLENKRIRFSWLAFTTAGGLLVASLVPRVVSPFFIAIVDAYIILIWVLFNARLQHELNDSHRATATSVYALFVELFVLLTYGVFALAAQVRSYAYGMQILAVLIGLFAALLLALSRRYRVQL